MIRAATPSLSPVPLAAIDIAVGHAFYQHVSVPIGLLLVTLGLLVVVGALTEWVVGSHSPASGEFERATPRS